MVLKILVYTFGAGGWGLAVWRFCELHQPNLPLIQNCIIIITSLRREYKARETCKMSKSAKRRRQKHTNPLCNCDSANCLDIVFWFERFKFRSSEKKSLSRPQEISCASLLIVTSAALRTQCCQTKLLVIAKSDRISPSRDNQQQNGSEKDLDPEDLG